MPLDDAEQKELKANISLSRKRELNFGLCLGKKPENTALVLDQRLPPKKLGLSAKQTAKTAKMTYGILCTEGKVVMLTCHIDPPATLAKKMKHYFLDAGLRLKVQILDADGKLLEEDGDEEDAGGVPASETTAPATDTAAAKWEAAYNKITPALKELAPEAPNAEKIHALWGRLCQMADAGDYANALATMPKVVAALKSATAPAPPTAQELLAELKTLAPALQALIKANPTHKDALLQQVSRIKDAAQDGDKAARDLAGKQIAKLHKMAKSNETSGAAAAQLQFFMTGLTGKTQVLRLPATTTVGDALKVYCKRLDVPSDIDAWISSGTRTLKRTDTLAEAEIGNEATLRVNLRLRGGGEGKNGDGTATRKRKDRNGDGGRDDKPEKSAKSSMIPKLDDPDFDAATEALEALSGTIGRQETLCYDLAIRLANIDLKTLTANDVRLMTHGLTSGLEVCWHDGKLEPTEDYMNRSLVRVRTKKKAVHPDDESAPYNVISEFQIGGRPKGKHAGGAQGQHVTSFVTSREILVGACCGLTDEQALENISKKFANLLQYPAFKDAPYCTLVNSEILKKMQACATASPDTSVYPALLAGLTLDQAMVFYLEVREVMPGASLAAETVLDVQGHGEHRALKRLQEIEQDLEKAGEGTYLTAQQLFHTPGRRRGTKTPGALDALLMLVDGPAPPSDPDPVRATNSLARLNQVDPKLFKMQAKTYVYSIYEAFGDLFQTKLSTTAIADDRAGAYGIADTDAFKDMEIGKWLTIKLCQTYGVDDPAFIIEVFDGARALSALAHATKATDRITASGFCAGLIDQGGGTLTLEFSERPKAYKEGGKEGDHTVAMTMLNKAMSGLLIDRKPEHDDAIPTARMLCAKVDTLLETFKPEKYLKIFYTDLNEAQSSQRLMELSDNIEGTLSSEGTLPEYAGVMKRFIGPSNPDGQRTYGILYYLDQLQTKLREIRPSSASEADMEIDETPVDTGVFLEIAENLLGVINCRPTAVVPNAAAASTGKGEPFFNAALTELSKGKFCSRGIDLSSMPLPDEVQLEQLSALIDSTDPVDEALLIKTLGPDAFKAFQRAYAQHVLIGLLDTGAIAKAVNDAEIDRIFPNTAAFRDLALEECCLFAQAAYPVIFELAGQGALLRDAINARITQSSDGGDDSEYDDELDGEESSDDEEAEFYE